MLNWIKNLFVGTPAPTTEVDAKVEAVNAAPYKVPEPAATTPIPLVVEPAPVSIVPVTDAAVVITEASAKKKPAPKKAPAKKTAGKSTTKRGRKPKPAAGA
jgi:hypothetical protein